MADQETGTSPQGQAAETPSAGQSASATASGEPARPRKRRWLRALVILVLLFGVFIAMLPVILSTGPGRSVVLGVANMFIPGKISADEMSLGWGRGQNVKGLHISNDGADILVVDEIDMPGVSLWGLLWGRRDFGRIEVAVNEATHLIELEDGSLNLMRALTGPPPPKPPEPEPVDEVFELPLGLNVELKVTGAMHVTTRLDGERRVTFDQFDLAVRRREQYVFNSDVRLLLERPVGAAAAGGPAVPGVATVPVSAELRPHQPLDGFLAGGPGTIIFLADMTSDSTDSFPTGTFEFGLLDAMVMSGHINESELALDGVEPEGLEVTLRRDWIDELSERFAATLEEMIPAEYRPLGIDADYPVRFTPETLRIPVRDAGLAVAETVMALNLGSGSDAGEKALRLIGAERIDGITLKEFVIRVPEAAFDGPIAIHVDGIIGNTHPATGEYVERQRQVVVTLTPEDEGTHVAGEVDVLDLGLADQLVGMDGLLQQFIGSRPGPFDATLAPSGDYTLRFDVPRVDLAGRLADKTTLNPGSEGRLAVSEALSEFVATLQPLVHLVPGEAEVAVKVGEKGVSVPGGEGIDLAELLVDGRIEMGEVRLATAGPLMEVLGVLRPLGATGIGGQSLDAHVSPIEVTVERGKLRYNTFELNVANLPFKVSGDADLIEERFDMNLDITAELLRKLPQLRGRVPDDFHLSLPLTGSFDDPKLDVSRLGPKLMEMGVGGLLEGLDLPGLRGQRDRDEDESREDDRSDAERALEGVGDLFRRRERQRNNDGE